MDQPYSWRKTSSAKAQTAASLATTQNPNANQNDAHDDIVWRRRVGCGAMNYQKFSCRLDNDDFVHNLLDRQIMLCSFFTRALVRMENREYDLILFVL